MPIKPTAKAKPMSISAISPTTALLAVVAIDAEESPIPAFAPLMSAAVRTIPDIKGVGRG